MKTPHPTHDRTSSNTLASSSRLALLKHTSAILLRARPVNRTILAAVSCLALAGFSAPKADAQLLLTGGFNGASNFATNWIPDSTVGALITVGASDLSVTSLGFGDFGQDGFAVSHQVGLWSTGAGNPLLGSVTLSAGTGDPLTDEWRFATLAAPITLTAGTQYFIGATTNIGIFPTQPGDVGADGDKWFGSDLGGGTVIQPDFVYSGDFTGVPNGFKGDDGGGFNVPLNSLGEDNQVYSLNLEYTAVPEPSVVGLMILAGALWMVFRRRIPSLSNR